MKHDQSDPLQVRHEQQLLKAALDDALKAIWDYIDADVGTDEERVGFIADVNNILRSYTWQPKSGTPTIFKKLTIV